MAIVEQSRPLVAEWLQPSADQLVVHIDIGALIADLLVGRAEQSDPVIVGIHCSIECDLFGGRADLCLHSNFILLSLVGRGEGIVGLGLRHVVVLRSALLVASSDEVCLLEDRFGQSVVVGNGRVDGGLVVVNRSMLNAEDQAVLE